MPVAPEHPLVSVDALARRLDAPDVRIVDCRWYLGRPGAGREAYLAGHIPGAIHLDLDADLSAPEGPGRHPLPDPATFAAHLATRGIGRDHEVVGYDDAGGWVAARLWWMLDNLGHPRVRVLDGGWGAWLAAGHPTTADEPALRSAARWTPTAGWTRTVDRASLKPRLGSVVLLDARAAPRYRGEVEPIDPVAGHIPTAINAPIDGNLGPDGRFLPPAELAARFRALGADPATTEVVTSCGSGTSACHHALAMRVAGLADPTLYVGSYSDWSRAGEPVATGAEPGTPVR
ncbi:MAG TPA: sulfurtransferase [Candidatus Limnocylindrales bacterium]|nr:sulfurtransferase [Candidatus Limnocylindrales bacterium]